MKTFAFRVLLAALLLMGVAGSAVAQEIITVSGKVLNRPSGEKPRPFPKDETKNVLSYYTIAAAEDALKKLQSRTGENVEPDDYVKVQDDGYYEIRVPENGALIFNVGMDYKLEKVNNRSVIDIFFEGGQHLDEVLVTEKLKIPQSDPQAGKIVGGKLIVENTLNFPDKFGSTNRRFILQPYLLDCNTEDTVRFIDPVVIDGKEYVLTQDRRMAYNRSNDALFNFVQKHRVLNDSAFSVLVKDSIPVPDPKRMYNVKAKSIIVDYTQKTYTKEWVLTTCKIKRPMQFLEYSFKDYELDPYQYKEEPRTEKRDTKGNISLTFLVNKAELDPDDPNNTLQMAKLQEDLMGIINGEGTALKEFKITGVSSPEGGYQRNLTLSKLRTDYALRQITSMIPKAKWDRVYKHPTDARVATWNEVADLLEKDTLLNEAAEVREITAKFESQDAQYAAIRKLPYYETAIKNTFPRLRTVRYEYKHEIRRALNPDEIVDRYYNDPNYREGGKGQFSRYEYWHLFQQIKDPKEAEKIFRRAYEETMTYDRNNNPEPWVLAANNLAVSLLRRDTFDVEVLKPLIEYGRAVNYETSMLDEITNEKTITIHNPENVVANQLLMYIRANDFDNASILSKMLPNTEKFKMVKAFSSCLGGYYEYRSAPTIEESERRKQIFELVKNSSPMNHVVMCMAMELDKFNKEALQVLETIPATTQTKYMKLQLFVRMNKLLDPTKVESYSDEQTAFKTAYDMLDEIIKEDPKFRNMALNDGEFSEEFMDVYSDTKLRKELIENEFDY